MANIIFKEKQVYNDKVILAGLALTTITTFVCGVLSLMESNINLANAVFLFSMALIFGYLTWSLKRMKLTLKVTEKSIKFKLFPFKEKQTILWSEVDECKLIETPAMAQWLGGNITFNHEKRISFTGRNGLFIKIKNGECYFIGCQNLEKLKNNLETIKATFNQKKLEYSENRMDLTD